MVEKVRHKPTRLEEQLGIRPATFDGVRDESERRVDMSSCEGGQTNAVQRLVLGYHIEDVRSTREESPPATTAHSIPPHSPPPRDWAGHPSCPSETHQQRRGRTGRCRPRRASPRRRGRAGRDTACTRCTLTARAAVSTSLARARQKHAARACGRPTWWMVWWRRMNTQSRNW